MGSLRTITVGLALATCVTATAPAGASDYQPWGGAYIGASLGYSWSDVDGVYPNHIPSDFHNSSPKGGLVGAHFGIQHQIGQFLIGVEAAVSGHGPFDTWGRSTGPSSDCLGNNTAADPRSCQHRQDFIFTVGPRLGWAPSNQWLLYATGGYASTNLDSRTINTATGLQITETHGSHDGWFIGGGVEYALTKNWIFGVEYQHLDFGRELHVVSTGNALDNRYLELTQDIVRARLSFKLGRPEERHEALK